MKKESEVLASVAESTRGLVRFYLSRLKDADMYKVFEANGMKLNSPAWLICHLVWAENYLLLKGTRGEEINIPWMKEFGIGSNPENIKQMPDLKESLTALKEVHEKAMKHIQTLSDEDLDKPNPVGLTFGDQGTIRSIIQHHIRHEGTHAGHLGWIAKLHGIKTI